MHAIEFDSPASTLDCGQRFKVEMYQAGVWAWFETYSDHAQLLERLRSYAELNSLIRVNGVGWQVRQYLERHGALERPDIPLFSEPA